MQRRAYYFGSELHITSIFEYCGQSLCTHCLSSQFLLSHSWSQASIDSDMVTVTVQAYGFSLFTILQMTVQI